MTPFQNKPFAYLVTMLLLPSLAFTDTQDSAREKKRKAHELSSILLPEFGDVEIKTMLVDRQRFPSPAINVKVKDAGEKTIANWTLEAKTDDDPVELTMLTIDLQQAGRDNGTAYIRLGIKSGEKINTRKISFPKGYAIFEKHSLDPQRFHFRWKLNQLFDAKSNGQGPISVEMMIVDPGKEPNTDQRKNSTASDGVRTK